MLPKQVDVSSEREGLDWVDRPRASTQTLLDRLDGVRSSDAEVLRGRADVAICSAS